MSNETIITQESIAGLPAINFQFDGPLAHAALAGATLIADSSVGNGERANLAITDERGEVLADVMVRKVETDKDITESVLRIGSALLWSHARYVEAKGENVKSFKIPEGQYVEEAIRAHALATFSGCRDLSYEVATKTFDEIWMRACVPVGRGTSKPRLVLMHGRHHITVFADDAVPAGEAKCLTADDATMCEAAPNLDGPGKEGA